MTNEIVIEGRLVKAPAPGDLFLHTNGQEYEVIILANEHTVEPARYPLTVVYKSVLNGRVWSKECNDFFRSMKRPEEIPALEDMLS